MSQISPLRISLFGTARVVPADHTCEAKMTRTVLALFVYLVLHRHRTHPREALIGLFWADQRDSTARGCLSTALWRLRRSLEITDAEAGTYLGRTADAVWFNRESNYWLDTNAFDQGLSQVLAKPPPALSIGDIRRLEQSAQLYTGDLLEGFHDNWVVHERERLRSLYLGTLARLMQHKWHQAMVEESITYAQRILRHDPLREEIHRELMRMYFDSGQRAQAVQQYHQCRKLLATELDVAPMEETIALYMRIAVGDSHSPPISRQEPSAMQQAITTLNVAVRCLDDAREQVARAIRLVEYCAMESGELLPDPASHEGATLAPGSERLR